MTEISPSIEQSRVLPLPHGNLSKRYALETSIGLGRGPSPYLLDTVESAIEQVQSLAKAKNIHFDPKDGLITFACADAINERCIADYYLPKTTKYVQDGFDRIPVTHFSNLHFYDIHMDDDERFIFESLGNAHEADIFKALAKSRDPNADTPRASLFIMKGINFFSEGNVYSDTTGKKLNLFNKCLPNFLTDVALVFIDADSPALHNVPGFTRIHTGDSVIEKESDLAIFLYRRPAPPPPRELQP